MHSKSSIRQATIFPTRPTHLRIKTQPDCMRLNRNHDNNFQIKRPLRTCRISQFQNLDQIKNIQSISMMKKTIPQRSIFAQFNLHSHKFKKQPLSSINFNHPIKDYISSFKEREFKRNVIRHNTGLNQQSQKLIEKTPYSHQRYHSQLSQQSSKQSKHLHSLIDQIYKKIDKFKEVGYTEKKINEWIQKYCLQKRKYMTNLLMKSSSKFKFSETFQDYFYERDSEKVKERLPFVLKKVNGQEKPIDQYDLIEFSNYIEEILVQKNRLKIHQLRDSIADKLDECFIYNRESNEYQFGKKLYPADLLNFVSDLEQIEDKYGRFCKISGFNREYFRDLGKTEKKVRLKIYDLIKITESKKKQIPEKQMCEKQSVPLKDQKPSASDSSESNNLKALEICDFQQS